MDCWRCGTAEKHPFDGLLRITGNGERVSSEGGFAASVSAAHFSRCADFVCCHSEPAFLPVRNLLLAGLQQIPRAKKLRFGMTNFSVRGRIRFAAESKPQALKRGWL
jgi:hypothetical protein